MGNLLGLPSLESVRTKLISLYAHVKGGIGKYLAEKCQVDTKLLLADIRFSQRSGVNVNFLFGRIRLVEENISLVVTPIYRFQFCVCAL